MTGDPKAPPDADASPDVAGIPEADGIPARAFIVGCARSGTTLLQSLLAAHPRVRSFPESHFFSWIGRSDIESARARMARFVEDAGLAHLWSPDAPLHSPEELVDVFLGVLDRAAIEAGRDVWIEKTPVHLHHIAEIERAAPGAKFVHILRNGADTIGSMHRVTRANPDAWGGKRSVRRCTRRWIRDVGISLDHLGRPRHHPLRYETLTTQPEATLREACRFLGLPFTMEMIEAHGTTAAALVRPGETWKLEAREEIRPSPRPSTDIGDLGLDDDLKAHLVTAQRELDEKLPAR